MNLIVVSIDSLEANQIHDTTTQTLILSILIYTLKNKLQTNYCMPIECTRQNVMKDFHASYHVTMLLERVHIISVQSTHQEIRARTQLLRLQSTALKVIIQLLIIRKCSYMQNCENKFWKMHNALWCLPSSNNTQNTHFWKERKCERSQVKEQYHIYNVHIGFKYHWTPVISVSVFCSGALLINSQRFC